MASIDQTAELNSLLEQQNKLYGEQSKMLSQQLRMTQQLVTMQQQMAGNSSNSTSQTEDLGNAINEVANNMDKLDERQTSNFDRLTQHLKDSDNAMVRFAGSALNTGKSLLKWAPGIAMVSGFARGLQVTASGMSGLFQVGSSLVGMFANLGMSILSLPFKLFDAFLNSGTSGGSGFREAIEAARKELGDLSSNEGAAAIDSFRSMRGEVAQTGLSVYRVFGNIAERMQYVNEAIKALGVTFTLVQSQFAKNTEAIGAYTKGLGLSEEAQRTMAEESIRSGRPMIEVGREMTSQAYGMGEAYGINGKIISRSMGEMMTDFDNFGTLGPEVLANVAVYARKLGVEVKSLQEVIGKFDNFEDAAKNAANLSQAFGMNVDALGMLNEQDPAARIERLRKSFFAAGKSVEMMTRQERALLATHTGLDQKTASLVFSQKNQSLSYADIQKKGDATKDSQLSQAEAMQKLSNSIERMVKSGSPMLKGFFATFAEGFERGIKRSREWRKSWRSVQRALRVTRRLGMQLGRVFVKAFPGMSDMLKGIQDFFSPSRIKALIGPINKALKSFFKGDLSFEELFSKIKSQFTKFFDPQGEGASTFKKGAIAFFTKVGQILKEGVIFAMKGLTKGFKFLADWLRNGSMPDLGSAADGTMGWLQEELFDPLMEFIRGPVAQEFWIALKDLATLAFGKFKTWLKGFVAENWKIIGAILFGPAIVAAIVNSAVVFALQLGTKALAGVGTTLIGLARTSNVGSRVAGAFGNSTKAVESAGGTAKAAQKSGLGRASLGNLLKVGTIITLGLGAIVAGIIFIATKIREYGLTPSLLAMASGVMIAAGAVLMEIGGVIRVAAFVGGAIKGMVGPVLAGLGAMTLVGAAMAGVTALFIMSFSGFSSGEISNAMSAMGMMTALFIAASAVMVVAGLAGAAILGTYGVAAGALVLGLAAMGVVIAAMIVTLGEVSDALAGMEFPRGTERKLQLLQSVVNILGSFASAFTPIVEAASGSLRDLLPGGDTMTSRINAVSTMFLAVKDSLVGPGGMIPVILESIKTVSTEDIEKGLGLAQIIETVMNVARTVGEQINVLKDDSFFGDLFGNGISPQLLEDMKEFMTKTIGALSEAFEKASNALSGISISEDAGKGFYFIARSLNGIFNSFRNLTPEKMANIVAMLPLMKIVVRDLSGMIADMAVTATKLGDGTIEQVSNSVAAMVGAINDINSSIKSLGNINLNSELRNLSGRLGLGDTTRLRIESGNLTLNLRLNVVLKVDEIEKAMLDTSRGGAVFALSPRGERLSGGG